MHVFSNLRTVSKSFNGILLDAYGVFWGGNDVGLLPNAKEAMESLVKHGKIVGILSNSSQLAAKEVLKLEKHGLIEGVHFHFLTTSGEVAKEIYHNEMLPFETSKKKFWLFGGLHPRLVPHRAIFDGTSYMETKDIQEADFIEISIPHIQGEDQTDPELFRSEVKKLGGAKLPMVCVNPDQFVLEGNPARAVVRQGAIAALYEELGGFVFYVGKPSRIVYEAAMKQFSKFNILQLKEILMIGDTPETDIRGARNFGMASALLMKTGIMSERISRYGLESAVQKFCTEDSPEFFIERLSYDEF